MRRINKQDKRVKLIEAQYPGQGVAEFVVECWQEMQDYNNNGTYSFDVLWNVAENRELTPVEAVLSMCKQLPKLIKKATEEVRQEYSRPKKKKK